MRVAQHGHRSRLRARATVSLLRAGRHEQAGAVVAQGCGAIGVAEDTGQCLDIDAEPRFTTLVGGHRRASCAGPQAFFYDLARPPGARLRDYLETRSGWIMRRS